MKLHVFNKYWVLKHIWHIVDVFELLGHITHKAKWVNKLIFEFFLISHLPSHFKNYCICFNLFLLLYGYIGFMFYAVPRKQCYRYHPPPYNMRMKIYQFIFVDCRNETCRDMYSKSY